MSGIVQFISYSPLAMLALKGKIYVQADCVQRAFKASLKPHVSQYQRASHPDTCRVGPPVYPCSTRSMAVQADWTRLSHEGEPIATHQALPNRECSATGQSQQRCGKSAMWYTTLAGEYSIPPVVCRLNIMLILSYLLGFFCGVGQTRFMPGMHTLLFSYSISNHPQPLRLSQEFNPRRTAL